MDNRARLCVGLLALTLLSSCSPQSTLPPGIVWHDAMTLTVEGKGWTETESSFDRLPPSAKRVVRKQVWSHSQQSAGICVRFASDAQTLYVRWTLTSDDLAQPSMSATGASGLDLYARHDGQWRWVACAAPEGIENEAVLADGLPVGRHEFMLYLPLCNGVSSLQVGVPLGASLEPLPPRDQKPIVFYGTSITQGVSASRPGACHVATVGRRLDWPVVNFGFAGNGKMEPEVVAFLAELDAEVFVIDCLPNLATDEERARILPAVEAIRAAHPTTPILLAEDREYGNAWIFTEHRQRNEVGRKVLREVFDQLTASGDKQLYYLDGANLIGAAHEATADGTHPNDLGYARQTDAFAEALQSILSR